MHFGGTQPSPQPPPSKLLSDISSWEAGRPEAGALYGWLQPSRPQAAAGPSGERGAQEEPGVPLPALHQVKLWGHCLGQGATGGAGSGQGTHPAQECRDL